jgi:hypothetical protein
MLGSVCGRKSVRFEPRGSQYVLTVGISGVLPEMEANPSSALFFASRLVSKGVEVDGMRDSLMVRNSRCDVDVKKKVKDLRVKPASLSHAVGQDNVIFVAQNKS